MCLGRWWDQESSARGVERVCAAVHRVVRALGWKGASSLVVHPEAYNKKCFYKMCSLSPARFVQSFSYSIFLNILFLNVHWPYTVIRYMIKQVSVQLLLRGNNIGYIDLFIYFYCWQYVFKARTGHFGETRKSKLELESAYPKNPISLLKPSLRSHKAHELSLAWLLPRTSPWKRALDRRVSSIVVISMPFSLDRNHLTLSCCANVNNKQGYSKY